MVDQNKKNTLKLNIRTTAFIAAAIIMIFAGTAGAKLLYVISDIYRDGNFRTPIQAYDMSADGTLSFHTQAGVPCYGDGAIGLAVDSKSNYLFVTYEGSNRIQMVQTDTMANAGFVEVSDAYNLAGIVFAQRSNILYCVERLTSNLHAFQWQPSTATLIPLTDSPFTLDDDVAYGIALDEIGELLYVANGTNKVNVYRTSNWSSVTTIELDREVVSVAVDAQNGFLYAGGGYYWDNFYLTQYNLASGTQKEVQVEPNACVMGLAVDQSSGLVYMSTGRNNQEGGDRLLVYDISLRQIYSVPDVGNPTGLVILAGDINPLNLSKTITGGVVSNPSDGTTQYVYIGEPVTYSICFDARNYMPNTVSVVDTLPQEMTLIMAQGNGLYGSYDETTHRYTWTNPPQELDKPTCLQLVARVKSNVSVNTVITNQVSINSDKTPQTTISTYAVATGLILNPINLNKNIIGYPTTKTAYINPSDVIAYAFSMNNNGNSRPVTNVTLVDTLPRDVSFISAERDGLFGQYDTGTHTYTWSYSSLAAGESDSERLLAKVRESTVIGKIITNSAVADSYETQASGSSINATIKKATQNSFNLSKSIIGRTSEPNAVNGLIHVNAGDTIAYAICFDNNNNEQPVNDVYLADLLPKDVDFIMGDGVFGQYDSISHSYIWNYASVPAGSSACVRLIGRIAQDVALSTTITNLAIIDSNTVKSTTAINDAIVGDVVYNPLKVTKSVVGAVTDPNSGVAYVNPGDTLVYSVCFNNNDNVSAVNDVSVLDILPYELSLVTVDGLGISGDYDDLTHTCKWTYPSLPAGSSACITFTAQVNSDVAPGTIIRNYAITDSNSVQTQTTTCDVIVKEAVRNPLNLSKSVTEPATAEGSDGTMTYVHPGDTVTYNVCFNNNDNDGNVNDITIIDKLDDRVTFVQADGDGEFGYYDPNTHAYVWMYQSALAGSSACLKLTVRVEEGIAAGTKITNFAIVDSNETQSTLTSIDVTTYYNPLNISKTVTLEASDAGGCVDFGQTVTYTICFDNNDNDQAISNVKIVDSLPQWVAFESADGNGVFGHYDPNGHTYTWSYSSVEQNSSNCVHIVCRVKEDAPEKTTISNSAAVYGEGVIVKTASADVVTCEKPIEAELFLVPSRINPRKGFGKVAAVIRLPVGISQNNVELEPLILYPFGIKSTGGVRTYPWGKRVRIVTYFEKQELVGAVGTGGIKTLRVKGKLKSGQFFIADGIISIAP